MISTLFPALSERTNPYAILGIIMGAARPRGSSRLDQHFCGCSAIHAFGFLSSFCVAVDLEACPDFAAAQSALAYTATEAAATITSMHSAWPSVSAIHLEPVEWG